ncbi:MAG: FG-GAP-like repeat-containing protein, partial [bacterium]
DPNSDKRLAELFQDGFKKAEADAGIDFPQFDSFILFHAGVGEDFAEQVNSTPNDIPSAFLTLEDLRKNLGNGDPSYRGIAVRSGAFYIPDGVILPETQTREITGAGFVEFGLLGTAALMFGHQLGLPNLFNTDNGASGIGYWGLMDQGSNNFIGLLPAQPEAWSKVFLGWERPVVITPRDTTVNIAAALHANPDKIYKIPITDSEYFLLENRHRDVTGDRVAIGRDINGNRIEFHDFPRQEIIFGGQPGVITQVDEYDFGLPFAVDKNNRVVPGSGILIWHIDEEVIRQNYASNRVNADINRRGVDLEEADGAQDIGRFYSLIDPGAGSENGVPEDAWWKSNPVIIEVFLKPVEFGPTTMPSTAANSGAQTGIVITNFSEVQPVMSFSVRNAYAVPNFPQYVSGKPNALPPLLADLTGDGKLDIVVAAKTGEIFAWQTNGQKVIDNFDAATIIQPNGLPVSVSKATFAILGDSLFAPPVLVDLNNDRRAEVLTAGKDGKLRAWRASDANFDGRADLFLEFDLGAPSRSNIAVRADSELIVCGADNGKLFGLNFNGAKLWEASANSPIHGISLLSSNWIIVASTTNILTFDNRGIQVVQVVLDNITSLSAQVTNLFDAIAVADLNNDGGSEIVLRNSAGKLYISGVDHPVDLPAQEKAGVAIADVNKDGRKEIVLVSKNQLRAYNLNGVLTENFLLQISTTPSAKTPYPITPIIADADGDEVQDVIVNGVDGNVYAYRGNGAPVPGFPLAMSGAGLGSLAAADMDGDRRLELVGISGNGYVHVWHLPSSGNRADWPMYHHDA